MILAGATTRKTIAVLLVVVMLVATLGTGVAGAAAAPLAAPAAKAQFGGVACTYRVVAGDVLSRIALRYGTTSAYLAKINNLANRNRIYAWSYLRVPCWDP